MYSSSTSSGGWVQDSMLSGLHSDLQLVSDQSTARPGCILEYQSITDATGVSLAAIILASQQYWRASPAVENLVTLN